MEMTQFEREQVLKATSALITIAKELTAIREMMENDRTAQPGGPNPNYKAPRVWLKFWG